MDARIQDLPFDPAALHRLPAGLMGLNARFLRGDVDRWQAPGRPLVDRPAGQTP